MEFYFYYNCGNHNLFEKFFERLNHLAHIIDDIVELVEMDNTTHNGARIILLRNVIMNYVKVM